MTLLGAAVRHLVELARRKATAGLEVELHELEAVFALLVVGSLAGLPLAPPAVTLRLLPLVGREVEVLLARTALDGDAIALLAGQLDVG